MEKTVPLTQGKFDELTEELRLCETVKRTEVSEAIKLAKEFGDLSENAEYSAAKEAQERLEIEIARLNKILAESYPIDLTLLGTKTVAIGNKVKVYDRMDEEELIYTLVSSIEANSAEMKLSDQSPIGKVLIGKKKGDVVTIKTPTGFMREFEILDISK